MTTMLEQTKDLLKAKEASIPEISRKIIEADITKTHVNITVYYIFQNLQMVNIAFCLFRISRY